MKKQKKDILFTFDYEPYLGSKSGSAEMCILEPTKALLTILDKYNAKAIFFIDVLYILNLKKHIELENDYNAIISQLKKMYSTGHYIFPHIHPHWLDAVYLHDKKEFSLSKLDNYSLSSLDSNEIEKLFQQSISFLKEIGISYEYWGYRAGGWCIQPFYLFKEIFEKERIKFEFSVLPGYKNDRKEMFFDYSSVTKKTPYTFATTVEEINEAGNFIEFPISTIQFSSTNLFFDKMIRKYLWKTNDRGFGDGIGAQAGNLKSTVSNTEMISIDILTIAKLNYYKKYIHQNNYMHWISHPKMVSKHALKMFDKFLKYAHSNFEINYDFKKI